MSPMISLHAIEAAVEQLDPAGRAEFRAWFEQFDMAEWDQQLEQDVQAGALDWLAEEALAYQAAGRSSER